jgi:hypothetical protein
VADWPSGIETIVGFSQAMTVNAEQLAMAATQ